MSIKWEETRDCHRVKSGLVEVVVHHHIDFESKTWLVSCYGIGIDKVRLKNTDLEKAKVEAIALVGAYLQRLTRDWDKLHWRLT